MRDILLQCAGVAAIAVALIHGVLGETRVFARATIEPARLRTLIRLVWQAGAALDHRDARLRIHLRRALQRLGDARPAFRLDGDERGRRAGGRGVLAAD